MPIEEQKDDVESIPKIFIKFLNYFCDCGGFNTLLQHIKMKALESESKDQAELPFNALELILKLFKTLIPYLRKPDQMEILVILKTEITKRFFNLSEKEIKDTDKEFLMRLLSDCKFLLLNYLDLEVVYEMIETIELELAYKFLVSPYFEKRLKGINSLNEIAERIELTEKYGKNNETFYLNISKVNICKYLTSEIFLNWIKEHKIIDILLGDSIHIEILKRGKKFPIFFISYSIFIYFFH